MHQRIRSLISVFFIINASVFPLLCGCSPDEPQSSWAKPGATAAGEKPVAPPMDTSKLKSFFKDAKAGDWVKHLRGDGSVIVREAVAIESSILKIRQTICTARAAGEIKSVTSTFAIDLSDKEQEYEEIKGKKPPRYLAADAVIAGGKFSGEVFVSRDRAVGGSFRFFSHAVPVGGMVFSKSGARLDMQIIAFGGASDAQGKTVKPSDFKIKPVEPHGLIAAAYKGIIALVEQKLAELPDPEKTGKPKTDYQKSLEEGYREELTILRKVLENAEAANRQEKGK
ncbi:MAG: hypothetical protein E3J72_14945 [Planctomycetota bacterium]|nr:MAG: hypothetical protein E3J72_14945 [Planctomycetota bacterium]